MKLIVIQKSRRYNNVVGKIHFVRETKEEILDLVMSISKDAENYISTYIQFKFED